MEEWKIIEEYPEYEVSNYGRVRSIDRDYVDTCGRHYHKVGQVLKLTKKSGKYNYVQVMVGINHCGKTHRLLVSRLVAKAFIPNPNNLPQVNHKDEDSTNNYVKNLEWCTAKYNINYGEAIKRRSKTKCRAVDIFDSQGNYLETLPSGVTVSKKYGVSKGTVSSSCNGKHLYNGEYDFKFHS